MPTKMKQTHIELIDPMEKLSPGLGGTGYVGPKQPADALALYVNAVAAIESPYSLNMTVWKVLRRSVDWSQCAQFRRLRVGSKTVACTVIGSNRDWWFVSVDAARAADILYRDAIDTPTPEAAQPSEE